MIQKSEELVREYPGAPVLFFSQKPDEMKKKELYDIHVELIKNYNEKADEFRTNGFNSLKIQPFEDWSERHAETEI